MLQVRDTRNIKEQWQIFERVNKHARRDENRGADVGIQARCCLSKRKGTEGSCFEKLSEGLNRSGQFLFPFVPFEEE